MKQVYWLDLPGNKYLKKIEASMLTPQGCVIRQEIRLRGNSRSQQRECVEILYDRDYVISKLTLEVLQPLKIDSLEQFLNLISGLWREIQVTRKVG